MLETTIYHSEGAYLTETYLQGGGNIIQGFDNYLKNQTVTRRRNEVTEADRLFSTSSATYQKVQFSCQDIWNYTHPSLCSH
jgi:chromatin modification-related protein EAF6